MTISIFLTAWKWLGSLLIINQHYCHITFCVHFWLCVLNPVVPPAVDESTPGDGADGAASTAAIVGMMAMT